MDGQLTVCTLTGTGLHCFEPIGSDRPSAVDHVVRFFDPKQTPRPSDAAEVSRCARPPLPPSLPF
jgi:hypothetical protein